MPYLQSREIVTKDFSRWSKALSPSRNCLFAISATLGFGVKSPEMPRR